MEKLFERINDILFYLCGQFVNNDVSLLLSIIYIFLVLVSLSVIVKENPVYCVLSLIGVFILATIFLLLLKVELLTFMVFIVYIGAIAVFFLFMVMMINFKIITKFNFGWACVGILVLSVFFLVCIYLFPSFLITDLSFNKVFTKSHVIYDYENFLKSQSFFNDSSLLLVKSNMNKMEDFRQLYKYSKISNNIDYNHIGFEMYPKNDMNIQEIGKVFYTKSVGAFLLCGLILLVSLLGCVCLTMETKFLSLRKQEISDQILKKYIKIIKNNKNEKINKVA